MTTDTTDRQLVWVVLAIFAVLVVLPAFAMGVGMMGMGPAMGGAWDHGMGAASGGASGWGASGWMLVVAGMQLLALAVVAGVGYLGYRALSQRGGATDPALAELRRAYARGELDDEEYERRRELLESES